MSESVDLSQYTLFPATPEQVRESRTRTHAQWGRGTRLEDYLERDARLDVFEHAANGRLTTWVLAPVSDPKTLEFLCSCETYRREGFVITPGETVPNEETLFGVASVYTPPRHRRKGAARRMMRLLHRVLAPPESLPPFPSTWGTPPPQLPEGHKFGMGSVLYSDVGGGFYSICGPTEDTRGWEVDSPVGTIWDVSKAKQLFADSGTREKTATVLALGDLDAIWEQDAALMRAELAASAGAGAALTYVPWRGVGAFQVHRNAYFLETQGKAALKDWGARVPAETDELAYATWTMDVELDMKTLIFTRIRAKSPDQFRALLYTAVQTASSNGLRFVETWNLSEHLLGVAAELGGMTETRKEHLNSIAWYGPGDSVKWLSNEKFVWC
ncbi:hypothetical protein AURDEDRAFT_88553 [Auricularia subglabra TFB-10046 SS5]|nr:hypothetical protein AURDEDRAFT_88553 [Auricularia subglabra TFB-10046 SS5]